MESNALKAPLPAFTESCRVPFKQFPSRPVPSGPTLWSVPFALLLVVQFTYGMSFTTFLVLPRYLLDALGASPSLVGHAHGAFALAGALAVPLVGLLNDRWGRKPVLVSGLILAVLTFAPLAWAQQPAFILALRALHGISFSMVFASGGTLVIDVAPPGRRAEAVGYFGTAMLVTNAFGPPLAELIAETLGWSAVFGACSLYCLCGLIAATALRPPTFIQSPPTRNFVPWSRPLAGAYLGALALGVGVGATETYVPAAMVAEGLARVSPFFVAYTVGAVLQRTFLGFIPDRIGRLAATVLSLLLYAVSMAALSVSPNTWLLPLTFIAGVGHGLAYPATAALSIDVCEPVARGRVTAISAGCFNLGFALGTSGLAPFEAALGFRGLVMSGAAAVALCALGVSALVPRRAAIAVQSG